MYVRYSYTQLECCNAILRSQSSILSAEFAISSVPHQMP
jgi:hypothetical protein